MTETNIIYGGNNMKKVLSVFLAVLMIASVFSCLSISVFAARTDITFVSIDGVVEPKVGENPTYSGKNSQNSNQFTVTNIHNNSTTIINGISWYDVTEQTEVESTDTFKAGHTYNVSVYLCANDGYIFPEMVSELFINGKDADGVVDYDTADAQMKSTQFFVNYTFPALEEQDTGDSNEISVVNIEWDFEMNAGELIPFDASKYLMIGDGKHIDRTYNKDNFINGIKWVTTAGKILKQGHRFYPRTDYYLSLRIVADKGYTFANNVEARVNYNDASVIDSGSNYIVLEYYVYPMGYGDEGWSKTSDGYYMYFYDDCGHFYRNQLAKITVKGKNYFYYFNNYGFRVSGFQKIKRGDGKTYYHYFNSNGTLAFGWQKIKRGDGKTYLHYFGTNGCMRTGWQKIKRGDGKTYLHYFGTNGCMRTGWQWIANSKGVKYRYYFGTNGCMRTGWQKIKASNGKTYWYYFYSNGVNVINKSVKIGKKTYKFNKYGICTNP